MRACLIICILFAVVTNTQAAVGFVDLVYEDGNVIVNYQRLSERKEVSSYTVKSCTSEQIMDDRCSGNEPAIPFMSNTEKSFALFFEGMVEVTFYGEKKPIFGSNSGEVWRQFIANFSFPDSNLRDSIEKYSPIYSFHHDEEYFPRSIEDIYGRPISDYNIKRHLKKFTILEDIGSTAIEFMASNGHAENTITLEKGAAQSLAEPNGFQDEDSMRSHILPVYWFSTRVDENKFWVNYFTLFSYDRKYVMYGGVGANFASHEIDRESVAVLFETNLSESKKTTIESILGRSVGEDEWVPTNIVYAGHLPGQATRYLACTKNTGNYCDLDEAKGIKDMPKTIWNGGKTKVRLEHASYEYGVPIVYVAHGSHAQTPAKGYYYLDVAAGVGVVEPAGYIEREEENRRFVPTDTIELDLNNTYHRALVFSGSVVRTIDLKWIRQHPFVRFPVDTWAENSSTDFDQCVSSVTCEIEKRFLPQVMGPKPDPN